MLTIQLHACETSRYTPHLFGRSRRPRVGDQEAGTWRSRLPPPRCG